VCVGRFFLPLCSASLARDSGPLSEHIFPLSALQFSKAQVPSPQRELQFTLVISPSDRNDQQHNKVECYVGRAEKLARSEIPLLMETKQKKSEEEDGKMPRHRLDHGFFPLKSNADAENLEAQLTRSTFRWLFLRAAHNWNRYRDLLSRF
jgi:hypothetical protein